METDLTITQKWSTAHVMLKNKIYYRNLIYKFAGNLSCSSLVWNLNSDVINHVRDRADVQKHVKN